MSCVEECLFDGTRSGCDSMTLEPPYLRRSPP